MPNHVTTVIEAPAEVIAALVRHYTDDEVAEINARERELDERIPNRTSSRSEESLRAEKIVDFNMIIPQPDNIEKGDCSGTHDEGVVCWYRWNVDNWGTKWGAYDAEIGEETLKFDTAWSHPTPIIAVLAERFPDAVIKVKYADEDLGYNLGDYVVEGGQVEAHTFTDGSDEALDFAAQLKYGMTYAELQEEWEG